MSAHRFLILTVAVFALGCESSHAQRVGRAHVAPRSFHASFGRHPGISHSSCRGCGFGGYGVFAPSFFVPPSFDYSFAYAGFPGYGGFGYYPAHFPPYPYPALLPAQVENRVLILEATHDWRNWSPTAKVITGPVAAGDSRVIGMGMPEWLVQAEPLGDVARRNRIMASQARPEQRAQYRYQN